MIRGGGREKRVGNFAEEKTPKKETLIVKFEKTTRARFFERPCGQWLLKTNTLEMAPIHNVVS